MTAAVIMNLSVFDRANLKIPASQMGESREQQ